MSSRGEAVQVIPTPLKKEFSRRHSWISLTCSNHRQACCQNTSLVSERRWLPSRANLIQPDVGDLSVQPSTCLPSDSDVTWRSTVTHPKGFCDLLESTSKGFHAPNDVLDVVYAWEPNEQEVEKVGLIGWKRLATENLEEIAEIISAAVELNI